MKSFDWPDFQDFQGVTLYSKSWGECIVVSLSSKSHQDTVRGPCRDLTSELLHWHLCKEVRWEPVWLDIWLVLSRSVLQCHRKSAGPMLLVPKCQRKQSPINLRRGQLCRNRITTTFNWNTALVFVLFLRLTFLIYRLERLWSISWIGLEGFME